MPSGSRPAHVQEDPRVVAAVAPRRRLPVDADVRQPLGALRLARRREQALAAQPLVDADPAVHPLRTVVGDDEHGRVVVGVGEQLGEQAVEVDVVVEDRRLEPAAGLVLRCSGSMSFQKPWCIRSGPISTIANSSHGFVARRCSASAKRRSVIS